MTWSTGWRCGWTRVTRRWPADPAIAKLIATRAAIGAVEQAVALVGNTALTRKNPLERHYRDVLCARVHTPQDDSILTAAGRSALAASRTDTHARTTGARTTGARTTGPNTTGEH